MTVKQLIDMSTAYDGITNAELARRLGWTPQILFNRMKTGKFSVEDWEKIGAALGAEFYMGFREYRDKQSRHL